jgi:general secretion pathway protein J
LRIARRPCRFPDLQAAQGTASAARGFTLVELLVAIWILAVVAIIAWRGLSALVATRDRLAPETDEVRAMLAGFGQMERDLAQAANPALVSLAEPAVRLQIIDGVQTLQILRFSEPLADGASAVQQITYAVIDGALMRQSSPAVRSIQVAINATPTTVRLIGDVASLQVREWRVNQGWVTPAPNDPTPPTGIEVQVTRSDGTVLRRVLLVG